LSIIGFEEAVTCPLDLLLRAASGKEISLFWKGYGAFWLLFLPMLIGSISLNRDGSVGDLHPACRADLSDSSVRHQRDTELRPEMQRVWDGNHQVYGVRKAWHQLKRRGFEVTRAPFNAL
jgi:hypothetical protein